MPDDVTRNTLRYEFVSYNEARNILGIHDPETTNRILWSLIFKTRKLHYQVIIAGSQGITGSRETEENTRNTREQQLYDVLQYDGTLKNFPKIKDQLLYQGDVLQELRKFRLVFANIGLDLDDNSDEDEEMSLLEATREDLEVEERPQVPIFQQRVTSRRENLPKRAFNGFLNAVIVLQLLTIGGLATAYFKPEVLKDVQKRAQLIGLFGEIYLKSYFNEDKPADIDDLPPFLETPEKNGAAAVSSADTAGVGSPQTAPVQTSSIAAVDSEENK